MIDGFIPSSTPQTSSSTKTCNCKDVNKYTCSTGFKSGKCSGPWNIQCCTGTVSKKSSSPPTWQQTRECRCDHGFAVKGKVCTDDNRRRCSKCDEGYKLNSDEVCENQKKKCTCKNGIASWHCPFSKESCISCDR